jgi:hypothetical protein
LPVEGKPCAPVAYGVPVSAIKSFLRTVPPDAVQPTAWLGIQGQPDSADVVKGVRVLSVAKNSPASEAKLRGGEDGDMIVGVGGQPVTTPEELATTIKKHAVGEKVPLTVFSQGMYRTVDVVLRAPPQVAKQAAASTTPATSTKQATASNPGVTTTTDTATVVNSVLQQVQQFATPPASKSNVRNDDTSEAAPNDEPAKSADSEEPAKADEATAEPSEKKVEKKKDKKKKKKGKKKSKKHTEKKSAADEDFNSPT